jgi:predicted ATPase
VLAESGARNRLEAATASGLTPFVGHTDEMGFLLQNWADVREGRGRVVSIRAEAGVGKSRLVDAFKARIAGDAFEAIHCPCSEYLRNSAFHPFAAALAYETDFSASSRWTRFRAGSSSRPQTSRGSSSWRAGDSASALAIIDETLSDILATHEHHYEPELHRVRGEIFAREANERASAKQQAEASFRAAMTLAGQQRAQALELRAATSLAAFLRGQGRGDEGRSVLSDVYSRFKKGFETRDLIAARAELTL